MVGEDNLENILCLFATGLRISKANGSKYHKIVYNERPLRIDIPQRMNHMGLWDHTFRWFST